MSTENSSNEEITPEVARKVLTAFFQEEVLGFDLFWNSDGGHININDPLELLWSESPLSVAVAKVANNL